MLFQHSDTREEDLDPVFRRGGTLQIFSKGIHEQGIIIEPRDWRRMRGGLLG